jgi:hypothetical protein
MTGNWGSCLVLAGCLAILAGCRTPQPNLKPAKVPEQLTEPSNDPRYQTGDYPKQAFAPLEDPMKKTSFDKGLQAGGGGMGRGGGGMGPSAGGGGRGY